LFLGARKAKLDCGLNYSRYVRHRGWNGVGACTPAQNVPINRAQEYPQWAFNIVLLLNKYALFI
jgi:hypothetical protein